MTDLIAIAVLAAVIGGAAFYVYRSKKRGEGCVGCPMSKQCRSHGCGAGNNN